EGVVLLAEAVAPARSALEQQREREAAGRLLEIVHGRETRAAQDGDGGGGGIRALDADGGDRRGAQARVEAPPEPSGRAAPPAGPAREHYAIRLPEAAGLLLDQLRADGVPERRVAAGDELLGEPLAELPEPVVPGVARDQLAPARERGLHGLAVDRQL